MSEKQAKFTSGPLLVAPLLRALERAITWLSGWRVVHLDEASQKAEATLLGNYPSRNYMMQITLQAHSYIQQQSDDHADLAFIKRHHPDLDKRFRLFRDGTVQQIHPHLIYLPDDSEKLLQLLQSIYGETAEDAIRRSIASESWITGQVQEGGRILCKHPDSDHTLELKLEIPPSKPTSEQ